MVAEAVEVEEDGVDSVVVAAAFATGFFMYLEKQTELLCPVFPQWLQMSRSCPPSFFV